MYNAHEYAIIIENKLKLPAHTADEIEKNPLVYIDGFLESIYEKDEAKARLIDAFDEKYSKYKNTHLIEWTEIDVKQMIHELTEILA